MAVPAMPAFVQRNMGATPMLLLLDAIRREPRQPGIRRKHTKRDIVVKDGQVADDLLIQRPREFGAYRWILPEEFDLDWLPDFKRDVYRQVMLDFFSVRL